MTPPSCGRIASGGSRWSATLQTLSAHALAARRRHADDEQLMQSPLMNAYAMVLWKDTLSLELSGGSLFARYLPLVWVDRAVVAIGHLWNKSVLVRSREKANCCDALDVFERPDLVMLRSLLRSTGRAGSALSAIPRQLLERSQGTFLSLNTMRGHFPQRKYRRRVSAEEVCPLHGGQDFHVGVAIHPAERLCLIPQP